MKIAILGCGYVGSSVGSALVARGHEVTGTTTTPARAGEIEKLGMTPAVLSLCETATLAALLADREMVFLTVSAGRRGGDYRAVYLEGVEQLLTSLAGSKVEHVVYTSSSSVYGQQDGDWVDEDSPTEPASERGQILLAAERRLLEGTEQDGRSATVLRLTGIYGPGRDPIDWARRDAGGERGDGAVYLNLIHRDDIVEACAQLATVRYHGVLNLTDDAPLPRKALYDRLLAEEGLPAIQWTKDERPAKRGKRIRNTRVKRVLGFKLVHPTH